MFTIRDNTGRTLGTVTPDLDTAETLARVRALTGRTIPVGGPVAPAARKRVPWARVTLGALAGVAVFGFAFGLGSGPNKAPATPAPAPAVPSTSATGTDVSWYSVDHAGNVISNGETVDNVYTGSSATRARYLAVFAANQIPVGNPNGVVSEGITFCEAVAAGNTVALRELYDSRADSPQFGTGARRGTVAAAATEYLCPRFDQ